MENFDEKFKCVTRLMNHHSTNMLKMFCDTKSALYIITNFKELPNPVRQDIINDLKKINSEIKKIDAKEPTYLEYMDKYLGYGNTKDKVTYSELFEEIKHNARIIEDFLTNEKCKIVKL